MVNDILDLSKVESGKLELEHSTFYLTEVIEDLNNLFGLAAREKNIRLRLPLIDAKTESAYIGDPIRVGQILINLVGNAIKFTELGSIELSWTEEHVKNNEFRLSFRVKDTGRGIEESQLESIFESFSQVNTTPSDTGTGLGLSISRKLAHMMGGKLEANSKPGTGSTFYFSVNIRKAPKQARPILATERQPSAETARLKFLLVEDSEINQTLAKRMLENKGYQVTVAENGAIALELMQIQYFSVVLMDIRMPVMDGLEAIKKIREHPKLRKTRVIAQSASVLDEEVKLAMEAGFDGYLPKPLDFELLHKLLQNQDDVSATTVSTDYIVRGVNFGSALSSHGGDVDFLVTLTGDFIDIYGNAADDLQRSLTQQDFEQAERLMHNIAGLSGTFGANGLMASARQIESDFRTDQQVEDAHYQDLKSELKNFVSAIHEFKQLNDQQQA